MIVSIIALLQIYLLYMLSLVVQDLASLIIIVFFLVVYVAFFGLILKRPMYSLYGFLLITLFFPKGGNNFVLFSIEELHGMSMCMIFQVAAALAICLNILRFEKITPPINRKLNYFCHFVFTVVILTLLLGLLRSFGGDYFTNLEIAPEELAWNVPMLLGLVFLYGCIKFVRQIEQAEKIFLIIIASAMAIAVESLLYVYLRLPLPLENYVFHESGRYHSIFFFDFVILALVCFGATGLILYFVSAGRTKLFLFCLPLFFLPLLATFQRTPLVSIFIVAGIFFMLQKKIQLKVALPLMIFFVWGVTSVLEKWGEYLQSLEFFMIRRDYFETYITSWVSRLGSYIRGFDVFITSFPMGVGPGRVNPMMSSSHIPNYLIDYLQAGPMSSFYHNIAFYGRTTGPHNFYINFICEYGLWGIMLMIFYVYLCFDRFHITGKTGKILEEKNPRLFAIQTAAYSILLAIAFWFLFYHNTFYWLMFFLLFLMFFVPDNYCQKNYDHKEKTTAIL